MALFIIGSALIILSVVEKLMSSHSSHNGCVNCSYAHKESGLNYSWLNKEFGEVLKIEYEEPVEKRNLNNNRPIYSDGEMIGDWKPYTDDIWEIHCDPTVIDHSPKKLVEQHMSAFINKNTRFARLRFTFKKEDKIYQQEPTKRFYELERDFFSDQEKCV